MSSTTEQPSPDEPEGTVVLPETLTGELVQERPVGRQQPPHPSSRLDVDYQESRYTSPLPSPEDLDRYAQRLPDAPERLLAAGEREQAHRHMMESRLAAIDEAAMPKFYAGQSRGQLIGLIAAVVYLGVMLAAILEGQTVAGIGGAAVGLAGVIWALRRDPSGPPKTPGESGDD